MGFLNSATFRRFRPEKMQKINLFETGQMFCDIYCLEPGQLQKVHAHTDATKFYYVVEGRGRFTCGAEQADLGPGEVAWSSPGEEHGVENVSEGPLVVLVAMAPNPNVA